MTSFFPTSPDNRCINSLSNTFAARPGSASSQAFFMARISSARSVSFFTSISSWKDSTVNSHPLSPWHTPPHIKKNGPETQALTLPSQSKLAKRVFSSTEPQFIGKGNKTILGKKKKKSSHDTSDSGKASPLCVSPHSLLFCCFGSGFILNTFETVMHVKCNLPSLHHLYSL